MIKAKLKAAGVHAIVTLSVALLTAILVFVVWYPGAFSEMVAGADLFMLVMAVEVVLGPAMSLVIYNTRKSPRELIRDYSVVGLVQVSALCYGLYNVAVARPVYLVFVKDRIEVVSPVELSKADLDDAGMTRWSLPITGPKLICTESPTNAREKSDLLLSALAGKDIQLIPRYYRPCREGEIETRMYAKADWESKTVHSFSAFPEDVSNESFSWLPVVTRFGAWVAVYPEGELDNVQYIDVNPFSIDFQS